MTIFAWMGVLVAVLLSSTLLAATIGWVACSIKDLYVHLCFNAEARARRDAGSRLIQESYWYSEDEAVMAALEIIGRKMATHTEGYCNISDCREEWRNRKGKSR